MCVRPLPARQAGAGAGGGVPAVVKEDRPCLDVEGRSGIAQGETFSCSALRTHRPVQNTEQQRKRFRLPALGPSLLPVRRTLQAWPDIEAAATALLLHHICMLVMSLPAPVRHLPFRCLSRRAPVSLPAQHQQRRTALFGRGKPNTNSTDSTESSSNPVLEEYEKNNQRAAPSATPPAAPKPGDIAASSIFEDDRRLQEQQQREADGADGTVTVGGTKRDPTAMARVLIPDPAARERWERKKVIQMVRKGGRLSKAQFLKKTEREHLVKSHNMKTSVKKLGMLARQIAGKTIDDAIVQMRFSNKKVAQDVLKQLEFARDEAVVMRGMGLAGQATQDSDAELENTPGEKKDSAVEIQLKDGKRHKVMDRSKIYIDQAWVGRGPYGRLPDYRARGQMNIMRTPWTSLSVVLKEEATRMREWEEREAKRRKKITDKVWTHLPDRPIQIQRQWYSW